MKREQALRHSAAIQEIRAEMSAFLVWKSVLVLCLGLVIFAVCFTTRLIPEPWGDRGSYVSVGERLLAGDKLYLNVYDNKDPLFYYLVAAQRYAGMLAEYVFEFAALAISFICTFFISLTLFKSRMTAAISGFIVAPVIITGTFYFVGSIYTPATALCILATLLVINRRYFLAGVTIAALSFIALIMAPIPMIFGVTHIQIRNVSSFRLRSTIVLGVGYSLFVAFFLVILAARGELIPYMHMLALNVRYSRGPLLGNPTFLQAIGRHFVSIFLWEGRERILTIVTVAAVIFTLISMRRPCLSPEAHRFCFSSLAALSTAVVVISLTGLWDDHILPMYFANTLIAVYLTGVTFQRFTVGGGFPGIAFMMIFSMLLSGTTDPRVYIANPLNFMVKLRSLETLSPEASALLSQTGSTPIKYGRIGMNEENRSHAIGLQNYRLGCPDFQQFYFYTERRLSKILDCAAKVPILIVSNSVVRWDTLPHWLTGKRGPPFSDHEEMRKTWNWYVRAVRRMLDKDFTCKKFDGGIRICKRRVAPNS